MAVLAIAAAGSLAASSFAASAMLPLWLSQNAAAIGWAAGSLVGNALFGAKGRDTHSEGPRLSDERIQTSAYGANIPIIAGTKRVSGNLIWKRPRREVSRTTSQSVGSKGGGGATATSTTYSYYTDFAILLCEGEVAGVRRLWINGALKYDTSVTATTNTIAASSLNASAIRIYPGSETQDIDPLIEADKGADAPAYRGYAYMVFENMDVTDYGGSPPQIEAEVVRSGSVASTLAISAGSAIGTTSDISSLLVLGNGANIWGVGAASNTALMFNFHLLTRQATYVRALWGYLTPGLSYDKNSAVFNNYGGYFGFLHPDGSVTEYSSAPGILGSNGVEWVNSLTGYAQGDSVTGTNFYRFALDVDNLLVNETLLTDARSVTIFVNACGIEGRCYVYGGGTYGHDVGYIVTGSNSKVVLYSGIAYGGRGALLVSRDGYLWMARTGGSTNVEKRDQDGTLVGSVAIPVGTVTKLIEGPDGMIWAYAGSGAMYGIHPSLLAITMTTVNVGTKSPLGFSDDGRLILQSLSGGTYYLHEVEPLPRVTVTGGPLDDFVTELAGRVGLSAADLDVTDLAADELDGYSVAGMSARSALDPLTTFFRFDMIESDYKIKCRKRGDGPVAVIPEADLAAHFYGQDAPAPVSSVRRLETELPREVRVNYIDPSADYEVGSQYARRLIGDSADVQAVELPIVMTVDEAAQAAEYLLDVAWAARTTVELAVSTKYAYLEPGDSVEVTSGSVDYTVRITEIVEDRGLLKLRAVTEDLEVLDTVSAGGAGPAGQTEIAIGGPTVLRVLDIPLLRDEDDGPGFYAAACGYYSGWPGAELWLSRDGGATFERTVTNFLEAGVIGSALTALPNFAGGNTFDESSTVQIQIISGELSSSTEALVLLGANACYLGGEILQFKNATLVSPGKYTLSGLLRGRRGTESAMLTHAVGDQFVLLNTETIRRVALATADIGQSLIYRAVTIGRNLAEAADIPVTPAAVGLEPLSSVQAGVGRTAAASYDIIIKWVPRGRLSAEWRDYVDVPTGESSESYEVVIYTNNTYSTVKRTLTASTPTVTYTSAQQVTDFGSNQATIYYEVFKLSATTGRGFALRGQG